MIRSNLGQVTTTIYRRPVVYRYPGAMPYYPYPGVAPGGYPINGRSSFSRRAGSVPGQPYQLRLTSEQIDKELYKGLPTKKPVGAAEGTEPQTVVRLESGLSVPKYILDRAKQREQLAKAQKVMISEQTPPLFHAIGTYATANPGTASAFALALGAAVGNWYYGYKQAKLLNNT